jgi:DNA-binding NarL/FixJ family response regulator
MTHHTITVCIGGGAELNRAGLAALINNLPGLCVVSPEMIPPPQVLVWEASKRAKELPSVSSQTALLFLVEDASLDSLPESADGIFSKEESPEALGIAIRQVARGQQYVSPSLVIAILQKRPSTSALTQSQQSVIESLTGREREILILFAQGLSNKTIAARLYLSVRRVEGQLGNMYPRLGVHSRTEAMLIAFEIR